MRGIVAAALALALATPFAGCSGSRLLSEPSAAANTSADDAKCVEDGWPSGSPEYLQCRQNLQVERAVAERSAERQFFPIPF
jgi:hypothetical protein